MKSDFQIIKNDLYFLGKRVEDIEVGSAYEKSYLEYFLETGTNLYVDNELVYRVTEEDAIVILKWLLKFKKKELRNKNE